MIDHFVEKGKLSDVVCNALDGYFWRNGLLMQHVYYKSQGQGLSFEQLEAIFEQVLPSISEPVSEFNIFNNGGLYRLMTTEMLNHAERVSQSLAEGVDLMRTATKGRGSEIRNDDEEFKDEQLEDIYRFIKNRADKPKNIQEWRKQRIKELQAELRRLTEQQKYEKGQQRQTSGQEQTQNNNEISQQ